MSFDHAAWKRRLSDLLREHPDIGRATGMFEANLNEGGVTKAYLNKKIKGTQETAVYFDQLKDKVESVSVRIVIG